MSSTLQRTGSARLWATMLAVLAGLLVSGCEAAPAPAAAVPALSPPADGVELRRPPGHEPVPHVDYYPAAEHRASVGGRVLVQFGIDAAGKATSAHVAQANANRDLQSAARSLVRAEKFVLTGPNYNSADPAPYYLLVSFCIEQCNFQPGFPADEIRVTGSRIKTT